MRSAKGASGKIAAIRSTVLYLLRCAVLLGALGLLLKSTVGSQFGKAVMAPAISPIGRIDLLHDLFYAILPSCAVAFFMPTFSKMKIPDLILAILALVAGCLCGWLPVRIGLAARPDAHLTLSLVGAGSYVAVNIALFIWLQCGGRGAFAMKVGIRNAYVVSDILLPLPLWSACRENTAYAFFPLRIVPVLWIGIASVLPWFFPPLGAVAGVPSEPALKRIGDDLYYQVLVDPKSGDLFLTHTAQSAVYRLNPAKPGERVQTALPATLAQSVAFDESSRKLIYASPADGASFVVDADAMRIVKTIPIDHPFNAQSCCRTIWNGNIETLAAFCGTGTVRLCPDGRTAMSGYLFHGEPGDAVFDPKRREIHMALISGASYQTSRGILLSADATSLEPRRSMSTPRMPERIALDPVRDRLLLTFPVYGRLMVLNPDTYEIERWVDVFPGVRAIAVDAKGRRLILAGFSPILEIRSLDDFSLIDRVVGPAYARWIDIDVERNLAYVTSGAPSMPGVWSVELGKLGGNGWKVRMRRTDPFYYLADKAVVMAQRALGFESSNVRLTPHRPSTYLFNRCPDEKWFRE